MFLSGIYKNMHPVFLTNNMQENHLSGGCASRKTALFNISAALEQMPYRKEVRLTAGGSRPVIKAAGRGTADIMEARKFMEKLGKEIAKVQSEYPARCSTKDVIRYENERRAYFDAAIFGTPYHFREYGTLPPFCISYRQKCDGRYYLKTYVGKSGKVQFCVFRGADNEILCKPEVIVKENVFSPEEVEYMAGFLLVNADKAEKIGADIREIDWDADSCEEENEEGKENGGEETL